MRNMLQQILLVLSVGLLASAFEYPKNLAEQTFIEDLFKKIPVKSDPIGVLSYMRNEVAQLVADESEGKKKLLKQYIDIAETSSTKCDAASASELSFMIDFHRSDSRGPLMEYLQHFINKQFSSCKLLWDAQFKEAISALSPAVKERMQWLIDSMMTVKFDGMRFKESPKRPYLGKQLSQLIAKPSSAGIVLFMVRNGVLDVDENMKDERCSMESFQKAYDRTTMALCSRVCSKLTPATEVYKYALNNRVQADQLEQHHMDRASAEVDLVEWFASKMICCAIVRSNDSKSTGQDYIMENTFHELTASPETMEGDSLQMDVELFDQFSES